MTNIVVVGGGFGGLGAALGLEKKFRNNKNIAVTLIDRRGYHLFTPNLYEAASSEEELTAIAQIKQSLSLSFAEILKGKNIRFIKGELKGVDAAKKQLELGRGKINYDYLILALGSKSDFFGIVGAEKYALELKDLPDALRIRNQIEFAVQARKFDINKKNIRLVVAGGGYTGVELAGELKNLADFLAWKNGYPREKIEIEILDAGTSLVKGHDSRLSRDVYGRLRGLGVRISLSARVAEVDEHFIWLMSGEKIAYDVLLWTAGVKAQTVFLPGAEPDKKGRLPVNGLFEVKGQNHIFALGDNAAVLNGKGQPVYSSAQDARDQADYLAYALPYIIKNQKPPRPYKNLKHGFIVNVGGKWAVMSYNGIYLTGYFAYLMDKLAHLRYYISVVGFWKALKCVAFQMRIYSRND